MKDNNSQSKLAQEIVDHIAEGIFSAFTDEGGAIHRQESIAFVEKILSNLINEKA